MPKSSQSPCSSPKPGSQKPFRLRIHDELDRLRSLEGNAFLNLLGSSLPQSLADDASKPLLILGIGPEPEFLHEKTMQLAPSAPVFWVEYPGFEKQMPASWNSLLPSSWVRLHPDNPTEKEQLFQLATTLPSNRIWRYAPAAQLFSSFWGPLLGHFQANVLRGTSWQKNSRAVLLPGDAGDLLTWEVEEGLRALDLAPVRLAPNDSTALIKKLRHERPAFYLSVNARGLDSRGERFRLLQACEVPVALWFVDNPWHILSSIRLPWWREATLFVTDASFIRPLRQHGAACVHHLPLGAWKHPCHSPYTGSPLKPLVFVGRATFPGHERFFAGSHISQSLLDEGIRQLETTEPPHVHWWENYLKINRCWPENHIRQAGWAADTCSFLRRLAWLKTEAPRITVFGESTWSSLLPYGSDIRPPLDYYTELGCVYQQAFATLNVTSLLLPAGLTQRHFDVWTAGGFLLTDATPGLNLFPQELVEPVTLSGPKQIWSHLVRLEKDSLLRGHLITAWQEHLFNNHTYAIRMGTVFNTLKKAF